LFVAAELRRQQPEPTVAPVLPFNELLELLELLVPLSELFAPAVVLAPVVPGEVEVLAEPVV
jgi:hypothetical protein